MTPTIDIVERIAQLQEDVAQREKRIKRLEEINAQLAKRIDELEAEAKAR